MPSPGELNKNDLSEKTWLEFFDHHSARYKLQFYTNARWLSYRDLAARSLPRLPHYPRVLDLGCGPAPSLPRLFKKASSYVCVDHSFSNLKKLSKQNPTCMVLQADLNETFHLPLTSSFDLVITFGLLQYLDDPKLLIERVTPLMNPGGYLLSHDPSDYWNGRMPAIHGRGFSREELMKFYEGNLNIVWLRSFDHRALESSLDWFLHRLRVPYPLAVQLWCGALLIERWLDRRGTVGTDWLLLAQRPHL